jgi:hypothetical protein
MTAITLNLLAEEQQAQERRAHDPVKVVLAIALGVTATVAAFGAVLAHAAGRAAAEVEALQARWDALDEVGAGEGEFQAIKRLADDIVAGNRARQLYAPQLALLKDLVPGNIQLSRLDFAIAIETTTPAHADEDPPAGKPARPKRSERLTLRLDGKAVAARPELEVDKFLQTLRSDERFSAVVTDIQLRSIARVSREGAATGSAQNAAFFVIECRYKEKP